MSNNENKTSRFNRPSERLTLFSICCPCLRPKKLTCRASDIALVMYDKDEPHEYVIEKLVLKRIPLRFFGVEEDFREYERSLKNESKSTCEKEIAVTNFDEIQSVQIHETKEEKPVDFHEEVMKEQTSQTVKAEKTQFLTEATSVNSLKVNCNTPIDEFLNSKLSFACEPLTEPKSGEELILRTITANYRDDLVAEVDQRIAKMSPDLEKTINVLRAVKPRPVSTQGTPMPIKNQRRLNTRNVEQKGIITKEAYNYMPCPKDNPLQGIHYTLNKTTFTPVVEETSKSIITELQSQHTINEVPAKKNTSLMVEEATTNYEDATVLAAPNDSSTLRLSLFNIPSSRNLSDEEDYIRSDLSSDSTNYLGMEDSRRSRNFSRSSPKRRGAIGKTDFSVYHAEVRPSFGRRYSPTKSSKNRNLKWKIVINNHSKEVTGPSTSTSELQLTSKRKKPSEKYISNSGISY